MNRIKQYTTYTIATLITSLTFSPLTLATTPSKATPLTVDGHTFNTKEILNHPYTKYLTPTVLKAAINGYLWAIKNHKVGNKDILTIVNFNAPSYAKRMWVLNLKDDKILMAMHVAQGKNTGLIHAKYFSNVPGSLKSSPGVYTTGVEYYGEHGKSMRVHGLESGINNNAYNRAIVIHPAWYVKPAFIKEHGYTGRSWGCFAVNPARADQFMHNIDHNSVLFAYAKPEQHDPVVNHKLTQRGKSIFNTIMHDDKTIATPNKIDATLVSLGKDIDGKVEMVKNELT